MSGPEGSVVIDAELVALVVVRNGRLPAGAEVAVAEAGGAAVFVGPGAGTVDFGALGGERVWWLDEPPDLDQLPGCLSATRLVVLPASPDGRDLAPRLAARMGRPLLAGAVRAGLEQGRPVADLLRVDGRVIVPAAANGPAVVTIWPGSRSPRPAAAQPVVQQLQAQTGNGAVVPEGMAVVPEGMAVVPEGMAVVPEGMLEPDPATMDLADAPRVVAGGAGLVPAGADDSGATAVFTLLVDVAAALGASAGATRVVTDAGWMSYERQIGTTGVAVQPELYVALGVSGASQHIGGIGDPSRVVSVNLDPSCPMTGRADLGLVADAPRVLVELARRLGVPVPRQLEEVAAT